MSVRVAKGALMDSVTGTVCDERRAIARVRLEASKTGYYPNLWRQDERGSMTLLRY